ncbi:unnamed protein product, partial [Rotaria magnacalcarata]
MIYEQEVSNSSIHPTTIAIVPTCQEFGPTLTKVRTKVVPLIPQSYLFDIPDEFKATLDGNRVLLMDELIARRERILVFSSDHQLDIKLMALPLMPLDQVIAGFEEIQAAADQLDGIQMGTLLTDFENNYLSNIDLWNVSRCDASTNNKMSNGFQYEYMNEASIDSELICIICNKTLEDPQCTPCDHIFCKSCITEWIQRNNMSCPTCRRLLRIHELIQASRTVRNILGKIHVKCMTCGKIDLERSDFEQHVAIACPAACLAADIMCPWTGTRGQLDNHLTNCSYQNLRPILMSLMAERQQLKEQVSQRTAALNQSKEETMQLKNVIEQHKIRTENSRRHFKEREMQDKTQMDQYLNKCRKFEEQLKREQNQNDQRHNEIDHLKDQKKELLAQMDKCKK